MGGSTEGWGARQMPPQMFHGSTCIVAWLLLVRGVYSYHYQFQESRLANPCSGWSKFWWQYILHGISVYFSCYPSSQIVSVSSSSSHRGQPSDKKCRNKSHTSSTSVDPQKFALLPLHFFSIWSCFRFLMYSSPFLLYTLFLDLSSSISFPLHHFGVNYPIVFFQACKVGPRRRIVGGVPPFPGGFIKTGQHPVTSNEGGSMRETQYVSVNQCRFINYFIWIINKRVIQLSSWIILFDLDKQTGNSIFFGQENTLRARCVHYHHIGMASDI